MFNINWKWNKHNSKIKLRLLTELVDGGAYYMEDDMAPYLEPLGFKIWPGNGKIHNRIHTLNLNVITVDLLGNIQLETSKGIVPITDSRSLLLALTKLTKDGLVDDVLHNYIMAIDKANAE